MLNSRHIFIQQGSLTSNDNGRKKFNKSEMRYEDEQILKWVSHVNDRLLEAAGIPGSILVLRKGEKDLLYRYTQLEHFSFGREITAEDAVEMKKVLEGEAAKDGVCFIVAGSRAEFSLKEKTGVRYCYLYGCGLQDILEMGDGIPILPEVRDKLIKRTLHKIKKVNEELEKLSVEDKVLIYGGGYQTEAFLRYANINRLDIVGVVDRKGFPIFNVTVKPAVPENIRGVDAVIVTPFYAADEIKKYLDSLGLGSRMLCLADICGDVLFTGQENTWAPDFGPDEGAVPDCGKEEVLWAVEEINRKSPYFAVLKENTPYRSRIDAGGDLLEFERATALVVQGPMVRRQGFTLRTIELYRRNFPEMKLILSVWEEDWHDGERGDLDGLDVEVVRVKKPEARGYQNVNLQLGTSCAGIRRAKDVGCRYAFKTRSDMRFYSPDLVALMYVYMKQFPLRQGGRQKERLVIFPPRYDYYFFIQDFFMFGNVDDMLDYWDSGRSFSDDYAGESAETMLGIRYAELIGERVENRLERIAAYDRVIKNRFAVVDDKMLDYVWYKYFYNKLWECEYHYNSFHFVDWLAGQEAGI